MAGYGSYTYGKAAYGVTVIRTDIQASVDAGASVVADIERILNAAGTSTVTATTIAAIERIFPVAPDAIAASASTSSAATKVRLADAAFAANATWAGSIERVRLNDAVISSSATSSANTTTVVNGVAIMRPIYSAICGLRRIRNVDGAINATLTFSSNARELWEPIGVSSETWTPIADTSETWTEIA